MRRTPAAVAIACLVAVHLPARLAAQPDPRVGLLCDEAGALFGVPPPLLKGIAFVESRWEHLRPDPAAPAHMPPAYGVMALRDDAWFGRSLPEAARLLGVPPGMLRDDPALNIRGAAALLAGYAAALDPAPAPGDLEAWLPAVARLCGIPQRELQGSHARSVYKVLRDGYDGHGIRIDPARVDMERVEDAIRRSYAPGAPFGPASEDYAPAVWDASPNYSSRSGAAITHVVIHDTEGSFDGSVSWLKNPAAQASCHYIFRSADGFLKQLVRESDKSWHAACWNAWTIGIEHEGYVSNPSWFTPVMYQQSALLLRHLTGRYGFARDRLHIVGHNVWQHQVLFPLLGWDNCNNHTDPGQFWNWNHYLSLIAADSTPPAVTATYPAAGQQNVPVYRNITLTFDRPMDVIGVHASLSVIPSVPGVFRWSTDGRTLTFDPTSYLATSASYIVSLPNTVRSAGGGLMQQPLQFSFTTAPPDTAGPVVLRSFPAQGATGFGAAMGFHVTFNEPVVFASFSGRVAVTDLDSSRNVQLGTVQYADVDDRGVLSFAPLGALRYGGRYRLAFLPGLRDIFGNGSSTEHRVDFTVEPAAPPQGSTVEGFETNIRRWQQPYGAPGSTGLDSAGTSFTLTVERRKSGVYAGKVAYTFAGAAGGVCRLLAVSAPEARPENGWLGLWVYGDNSGNLLEYWFDTGSGTAMLNADTLAWFGWKFVRVPLGGINPQPLSLAGIVIRQRAAAARSGAVFVDDMQLQNATGVAESAAGIPGGVFTLHQNYPNPFNPVTVIPFSLEREEAVNLSVFDALGRRVGTLMEKRLGAGDHRIEFSTGNQAFGTLPSGVYFYRLQTSAGVQVRKMVLMR